MNERWYPCHYDPDLFFANDAGRTQRAKGLCEQCPLSTFAQCQNDGWAHEYGVFGGLSPEDRRSIDEKRVRCVTQKAVADADRIDRELSRNAMLRMLDGGMPIAEIAQRVGKPPNTVKSYIHRAKKRSLVYK